MLFEIGKICSVVCLSFALILIVAVYAVATIILGGKPAKRMSAMEKRHSIMSNGFLLIGILTGITLMFFMSLEPYSIYSGFSTNYSDENILLMLIILMLSIVIAGLATINALSKYPYKPDEK